MTYIQFQSRFPTESAAIAYFVSIRYPNGVFCPRCGELAKRRSDRPKVCNCSFCKTSFSVFAGTVFEKSRTSFRTWLYAANLFLNAKQGISALQLQREIGVTYKTAWRMLMQIRRAMGNAGAEKAFSGIVEVDETYVGGKPRKANNLFQIPTERPRYRSARGRGTKKIPVIGVKERASGNVFARVAIPDRDGRKLTGKQLLSVISAACQAGTTVATDDFSGYNILNHEKTSPERFTHLVVNHSLGQYSAGDGLHTNGIEGFWAILKRAVNGSYHHVSKKHLQRYVDECCFRQNNRLNRNPLETLLEQGILS